MAEYAVERGDRLSREEAFRKARELSARTGGTASVRLADDLGFEVAQFEGGVRVTVGGKSYA